MDLIQAEGVKGLSVCAIYTRQSSNTRSDLTSCQIQFEACEAFIRAHKHNGWRWIEEHFNDTSGRAPRWTGRRFNVFLQRSEMAKSTDFLSTSWTACPGASSIALSS
jgi:hypothetical protein